MAESDLKTILSQCDAILGKLKNIPKDLTIEVEFCATTDDLYEKRCCLTTNATAKEHLQKNKEKYRNACGCYIIPPINNHFVILLKNCNIFLDAYNYLHEFVHVCNYLDYISINGCNNLFEPFENHAHYLWDEYNARYISTCVMIEFLESRCEKEDISSTLKMVCNCLRQNSLQGDIRSYDGSQLLGTVAAMRRYGYIKCYEEYLSSNEVIVLNEYAAKK